MGHTWRTTSSQSVQWSASTPLSEVRWGRVSRLTILKRTVSQLLSCAPTQWTSVRDLVTRRVRNLRRPHPPTPNDAARRRRRRGAIRRRETTATATATRRRDGDGDATTNILISVCCHTSICYGFVSANFQQKTSYLIVYIRFLYIACSYFTFL